MKNPYNPKATNKQQSILIYDNPLIYKLAQEGGNYLKFTTKITEEIVTDFYWIIELSIK
jgi:hypothetical protein